MWFQDIEMILRVANKPKQQKCLPELVSNYFRQQTKNYLMHEF